MSFIFSFQALANITEHEIEGMTNTFPLELKLKICRLCMHFNLKLLRIHQSS